MLNKITCYFLASLFLTSSMVLPLGDLSLLRDIPAMYNNYTKITTPEEAGVIDFIGDYLFHGKDLFGHNEHDKVPARGNDVQFQHQAIALNVVLVQQHTCLLITAGSAISRPLFYPAFRTSQYQNKLLRPPLA